MTIDEAIAHAREEAKMKMAEYENHYDKDGHYYPRQCKRYAEQQEQLADWLEQLKAYRQYIDLTEIPEQYKLGFQDGIIAGNNKAIDDLIAKCENAKFAESDEIALSDIHTGVNSGLSMSIHFAEQLKAGEQND